MLELGENSRQFHYEVGQFAAENSPELLICIGELAAEIGKGLLDAGAPTEVKAFASREEALPYLRNEARSGDLILFKGSNSMRLGELIEALKG